MSPMDTKQPASPDPNYKTVIKAYKRLRKACENGTGMRLSAHEVESIWTIDDSMQNALLSADRAEAVAKKGK